MGFACNVERHIFSVLLDANYTNLKSVQNNRAEASEDPLPIFPNMLFSVCHSYVRIAE